MKWGLLVVLSLLVVIIVSGCTNSGVLENAGSAVFGTTIQELNINTNNYVNTVVTVSGTIKPTSAYRRDFIMTGDQGYYITLIEGCKEENREYDYVGKWQATGIVATDKPYTNEVFLNCTRPMVKLN